MSENNKVIRVPFNLNRGNPEHEKIYAILEKQKNKNAFIREAILSYYAQSIITEHPLTKEEVLAMIREAREEIVEALLQRLREEKDTIQSTEKKNKEIDYDTLRNLF